MNAFDDTARVTGHRPAEITNVIGSPWTDPAEAVAEQVGEAWVAAHVYQAHAGDHCSMDPLIIFAKPGFVRTERATTTSEGFESMRERWLELYANGRGAHRVKVLPVEHTLFPPDVSAILDDMANEEPIVGREKVIAVGPSIADRLREATAFFEQSGSLSGVDRIRTVVDAATEKNEPVAPAEDDAETSLEWSLVDEMHVRIADLETRNAELERRLGESAMVTEVVRTTAWRYLRDVACVAVGCLAVLVPFAFVVGASMS